MLDMRKTRLIENCRCYHLISRLYPPAARLLAKRGAMRGAHQAFFLDDDEKTRRGYAFIYGNGDWETICACHEKSMREAMGEVLAEREREKEERETKGRDASSVRRDPSRSKADRGLKAPKGYSVELERGNPTVAERILELLAEDGPMRPSALRKAVGIRSSIHFNRYYLSPLLERGIIVRTDPDHPQSPQQRYRLA